MNKSMISAWTLVFVGVVGIVLQKASLVEAVLTDRNAAQFEQRCLNHIPNNPNDPEWYNRACSLEYVTQERTKVACKENFTTLKKVFAHLEGDEYVIELPHDNFKYQTQIQNGVPVAGVKYEGEGTLHWIAVLCTGPDGDQDGEPDPTVRPTPIPGSPRPSASPSPEVSPSPSPSSDPGDGDNNDEDSGEDNNSSNDSNDNGTGGSSSSSNNSSSTSTGGQVLGASYAATGITEDIVMSLVGMSGAGMAGMGALLKRRAS